MMEGETLASELGPQIGAPGAAATTNLAGDHDGPFLAFASVSLLPCDWWR